MPVTRALPNPLQPVAMAARIGLPTIRAAMVALMLATLAAAAAEAAGTDTGELEVSAQGRSPAVAVGTGGRAVVVWEDGGIAARTYLHGQPEGPAAVLAAGATDALRSPVVAAAATSGRFVIAWLAKVEPEVVGCGPTDVSFRRLRRDGRPQGAAVVAARGKTCDDASALRVAAASGGRFALAWQEEIDTNLTAIRLARYGANGGRLQPPVTFGAGEFLGGLAATDAAAGVAWSLDTSCGSRHFDRGSALQTIAWTEPVRSRVHRVNDAASCDERGPATLGLFASAATFLGVYEGHRYTAQRYDPVTGEPLTLRPTLAELPVCTDHGCARVAAVAVDDRGQFALVWEVRGRPDARDVYALQAQLYDRGGVPRGPRRQVSLSVSQSPQKPAAALAADGTLAVTWEVDNGSGEPSIAMRLLSLR